MAGVRRRGWVGRTRDVAGLHQQRRVGVASRHQLSSRPHQATPLASDPLSIGLSCFPASQWLISLRREPTSFVHANFPPRPAGLAVRTRIGKMHTSSLDALACARSRPHVGRVVDYSMIQCRRKQAGGRDSEAEGLWKIPLECSSGSRKQCVIRHGRRNCLSPPVHVFSPPTVNFKAASHKEKEQAAGQYSKAPWTFEHMHAFALLPPRSTFESRRANPTLRCNPWPLTVAVADGKHADAAPATPYPDVHQTRRTTRWTTTRGCDVEVWNKVLNHRHPDPGGLSSDTLSRRASDAADNPLDDDKGVRCRGMEQGHIRQILKVHDDVSSRKLWGEYRARWGKLHGLPVPSMTTD
ncbi:hypothetical protein OF83DRAFT_1080801 [Amylostereum chailletii]|nr:hypothetical protein OF83DRAFT_1080801 [Amylostereum chailletii]